MGICIMESGSDGIIVIDDVPIEACIIEDMLIDAGFRNIRTYSDPLSALKNIPAHYRPKLLIIDYHMPEMTGVEVIEEVRRRYDAIDAILITGDYQKVKQLAPRYRVLEKNLTFHNRLLSCVEEILGAGHEPSSNRL